MSSKLSFPSSSVQSRSAGASASPKHAVFGSTVRASKPGRRLDRDRRHTASEEVVGDPRACLTAETFDGKPITGCRSIVGIPTLLPLAGFPVFP